MRLIKKQTIKKWVAGMMLPVTALGAVTGVVSIDSAINSTQVSATIADGIYSYSLIDSSGNNVGDKTLYTNDSIWYAHLNLFYWDSDYTYFKYDYYDSSKSGSIGPNSDLFSSTDMFSDNPDDVGFMIYSSNQYLFTYLNQLKTVKVKVDSDVYDKTAIYKALDSIKTGLSEQCMVVNAGFKLQSYTLTRTTLDEMSPKFETQVFLTDVDSPISMEYILKNVKFVDEVDGDIIVTNEMITEDNYTSNKNKVGKWTIKVSVTDKAGNVGTGEIEVWVQDKTAPIITGKTTYTSNMSSPITREYIESQLSVSDNVDESVELTLVSDNFSGKENIVGKKTIIYRATDSAGNTSTDYTITINCVDDIKPTITGESKYTTSYKVALEKAAIEETLILKDNISTDLKLEKVSDNYSGNESIPGTYYLKYRTTDTAGNISDVFTVTIEVTDKIPPVFYTSGLFIGVSKAQTLSHQDIVNILLTMSELEDSSMGVSLLSLDGYEVDSINSPGVYTLSYCMVAEDGTQGEVQTASIKVLGEEEVKETDEKEQVEQRVNKFSEKIKNAFKNIGEFFVKIFKSIAWIFTLGKVDPKWNEWY